MEKNLQSIDRIFSVIELIAESEKGLGISEITRIIGLPKSTVHRIVNSLTEKNYLMKDKDNEKFKLGYKFIAIAGDYVAKLDIRAIAAPYINDLAKKFNVSSHLAIRQGNKAIYIDKIEPYSHICMYSEIGKSIDLYCSALGKSLLLGSDDLQIKSYLNNLEMKQFTVNTLTKDNLYKELENARKTNITTDNAEHEEGIYCMASPIYDYKDNVIAAISIASQNSEILTNNDYKKTLLDVSKKISSLYGRLL